jgi:hypothetical protein
LHFIQANTLYRLILNSLLKVTAVLLTVRESFWLKLKESCIGSVVLLALLWKQDRSPQGDLSYVEYVEIEEDTVHSESIQTP